MMTAMRRVFSLIMVVMAVPGLAVLGALPARAADRDVVESWEVTQRIDEAGLLHVSETLVWRFGSNSGRHGIVRTLVTREPVEDAEEPTDALYEVSDIKVTSPDAPTDLSTDRSCTPSNRNCELELRIGDPDVTIDAPTATYTIEYTVSGAMRSFAGHDELHWDVVGPDTPEITRLSVNTEVPGGAQQIACYSGPVGSTNPCTSAQVIQGRASFTQEPKSAGKIMTVSVAITPGLVSDNQPHLHPAALSDVRRVLPIGGGAIALSVLFSAARVLRTRHRFRDEPAPQAPVGRPVVEETTTKGSAAEESGGGTISGMPIDEIVVTESAEKIDRTDAPGQADEDDAEQGDDDEETIDDGPDEAEAPDETVEDHQDDRTDDSEETDAEVDPNEDPDQGEADRAEPIGEDDEPAGSSETDAPDPDELDEVDPDEAVVDETGDPGEASGTGGTDDPDDIDETGAACDDEPDGPSDPVATGEDDPEGTDADEPNDPDGNNDPAEGALTTAVAYRQPPHPPEISPALGGYLADGRLEMRDVMAFLLDLAVRGVLRIGRDSEARHIILRLVDPSPITEKWEQAVLVELFGKQALKPSDTQPRTLILTDSTKLIAAAQAMFDGLSAKASEEGLILRPGRRPSTPLGKWGVSRLVLGAVMLALIGGLLILMIGDATRNIALGAVIMLSLLGVLAPLLVMVVLNQRITERVQLSAAGSVLADQIRSWSQLLRDGRSDAFSADADRDLFSDMMGWAVAVGREDEWIRLCEELASSKADFTSPVWYDGTWFSRRGLLWLTRSFDRAAGTVEVPRPSGQSGEGHSGSSTSPGSGFFSGRFAGGGGGGGGARSW